MTLDMQDRIKSSVILVTSHMFQSITLVILITLCQPNMSRFTRADHYEDYLINYLKNSTKLALLLDYDGTLTPIVSHPDLAKIPLETRTILDRLSQNPNIFLAVISGRSAENVKHMVGLQNIVYSGNHGLEVIYPDGSKYVHQLPNDSDDKLKALVGKLEEKVVKDGAWIENKGASLTFHFRAVPENLQGDLESEARKIIEDSDFKVGDSDNENIIKLNYPSDLKFM